MFAPCTSEQATYAIESATISGAQTRHEIAVTGSDRAGYKIATVLLARTGALRPSDLGQRVEKNNLEDFTWLAKLRSARNGI
jgi:hypothetical protein